jgi:hypothetical protein
MELSDRQACQGKQDGDNLEDVKELPLKGQADPCKICREIRGLLNKTWACPCIPVACDLPAQSDTGC